MLCLATASAINDANRAEEEELRARASARAALLTPLAKAYATDIAVEVASSAVQVCGGMGDIEETGVAQFYRDARILPIYEGANGIQADDLVARKLGLDDGQTLQQELGACEKSLRELTADSVTLLITRLRQAVMKIAPSPGSAESLTAAAPILRCLATVLASGWLAKVEARL